MCSQHLARSLLSLAGHRDKLKIKSTRKIIYKSTPRLTPSIPTAQLGTALCPPGEGDQCFPQLFRGSGAGIPQSQARAGQQWQTHTVFVVLEPLATKGLPLPLPPGTWGSLSAPTTCTSHSSRKKPKQSRWRPRDREQSRVPHSCTESLWQREHLAALSIGASPFDSTQAF